MGMGTRTGTRIGDAEYYDDHRSTPRTPPPTLLLRLLLRLLRRVRDRRGRRLARRRRRARDGTNHARVSRRIGRRRAPSLSRALSAFWCAETRGGRARATTARLGGDVAAAAHEALDALEWREEETSADQHGASGPSGSAWSAVIKGAARAATGGVSRARRLRRPPLTRGDAIGTRARRREPRRRGRRRRRHPARRRRASRVSPREMARGDAVRGRGGGGCRARARHRGAAADHPSGAPRPPRRTGPRRGSPARASLAANESAARPTWTSHQRAAMGFHLVDRRRRLARSRYGEMERARAPPAARKGQRPRHADAADPAPNARRASPRRELAAPTSQPNSDVRRDARHDVTPLPRATWSDDAAFAGPSARSARVRANTGSPAEGAATTVERRRACSSPRSVLRHELARAARNVRCASIAAGAPDDVRRRAARRSARSTPRLFAGSAAAGAARARWSAAHAALREVASEEARITAVVSARPEPHIAVASRTVGGFARRRIMGESARAPAIGSRARGARRTPPCSRSRPARRRRRSSRRCVDWSPRCASRATRGGARRR